MDKILEFLLPKLTTKKVIIGGILGFLIITIVFPYIDTNIFYSNRIKNRIEILDAVSQLELDKINEIPELAFEYESILLEIEKSNSQYANILWSNSDNETSIWKFMSGDYFSSLLH